MSQPEECPFDDIAESESARVINVGQGVVSFLTTSPSAEYHSLVIPKRHVTPPYRLYPNEHLAIQEEIDRLRAIMLKVGFKGVDSFQKSRPEVPQGHNGTKVNHYHWHVLPSQPGDELYETGLVWTKNWVLSEEERKKWIAALRPS